VLDPTSRPPRDLAALAVRSSLLGLAVVGLVLVAWYVVAPPTAGPRASGSAGPYTLDNSTRSVALTLPKCAAVTVDWQVVRSGDANFSIWSPEEIVASDCPGESSIAPTACPGWACGNVSLGPGPTCFETGDSGVCIFNATQLGYTVLLDAPLGSDSAPTPLGALTVVVEVSWTLPPDEIGI
jgi:hypothetical protein